MFSKNKKMLPLLGAALAAVVTLVACGTTAGTGTPNENAGSGGGQERLTVAVQGNPVRLDPHNSNDSASSLINVQIFETLVRQTEDLEIEPLLAESYQQVDDRTWQFVIREGVQFHNGDTLTIEDVAFSLERAKNSPQVAEIVGMIDEIEIVDERTINVSTEYPFAPFLRHLAHPAGSIVSKADVETVEGGGGDYGQNPIGTGPFVFEEFVSGDFTRFSVNEDYWGTKPAFNELIVRVIGDGGTRSMALETGEIDISLDVIPIEVGRMEDNENVNLLREPNLSTNYIGFNMNHPHLSDVRVRQAISYAVDVDGIMNAVMLNVGQRAQGPIGPNVWGFNPNLRQYDFNIERARELMAEAGLEDGFDLEIWANSETPARIDIATIVANVLRNELNINAEIRQVEWSSYLIATERGEADMFILGWGTITGDADYGLYSLFHSESPAGAGNRVFFNNARVDELLELGRSTTDEEERLAAYHEIQEIIVEEAPWVFINNGEVVAGVQPHVRGFVLNPTNAHRFQNVYFE